MSAVVLSTKSKENEVVSFLSELRGLLDNPAFNVCDDIVLVKKKKPDDEAHSTPYTLLDLDYDVSDVVERLKELKTVEYSETLIDKDDVNPPLLFVFGKDINGKLVYIKLKIKGDQKKRVLCVSFHYAKEKMQFPYA